MYVVWARALPAAPYERGGGGADACGAIHGHAGTRPGCMYGGAHGIGITGYAAAGAGGYAAGAGVVSAGSGWRACAARTGRPGWGDSLRGREPSQSAFFCESAMGHS